MSNKKLTLEKAVKSGKDFRCVESGCTFHRIEGNDLLFTGKLSTSAPWRFAQEWLDQTFEIIEVKKELTASEIEEAFEYAWENCYHADKMIRIMLKKLGF
jgi:hypothetical protein